MIYNVLIWPEVIITNFMKISETWKPIVNYEDLYEISCTGRVKALVRDNRFCKNEASIMTPQLINCGYLQVGLCKNKRYKRFLVHRLVAQAFVLNPESRPQVNHINGIKVDNCIENLEWVTPSENRKHAFRIGLSVPKRGEANHYAKLTESQVKRIRLINEITPELSHQRVAGMFKVTQTAVSDILSHRSWRHI